MQFIRWESPFVHKIARGEKCCHGRFRYSILLTKRRLFERHVVSTLSFELPTWPIPSKSGPYILYSRLGTY